MPDFSKRYGKKVERKGQAELNDAISELQNRYKKLHWWQKVVYPRALVAFASQGPHQNALDVYKAFSSTNFFQRWICSLNFFAKAPIAKVCGSLHTRKLLDSLDDATFKKLVEGHTSQEIEGIANALSGSGKFSQETFNRLVSFRKPEEAHHQLQRLYSFELHGYWRNADKMTFSRMEHLLEGHEAPEGLMNAFRHIAESYHQDLLNAPDDEFGTFLNDNIEVVGTHKKPYEAASALMILEREHLLTAAARSAVQSCLPLAEAIINLNRHGLLTADAFHKVLATAEGHGPTAAELERKAEESASQSAIGSICARISQSQNEAGNYSPTLFIPACRTPSSAEADESQISLRR